MSESKRSSLGATDWSTAWRPLPPWVGRRARRPACVRRQPREREGPRATSRAGVCCRAARAARAVPGHKSCITLNSAADGEGRGAWCVCMCESLAHRVCWMGGEVGGRLLAVAAVVAHRRSGLEQPSQHQQCVSTSDHDHNSGVARVGSVERECLVLDAARLR